MVENMVHGFLSVERCRGRRFTAEFLRHVRVHLLIFILPQPLAATEELLPRMKTVLDHPWDGFAIRGTYLGTRT